MSPSLEQPKTPIPGKAQDWLSRIGDLPDHYHGQIWDSGVMPNNFLFFLRTQADQLAPLGVTHNLHHRVELVVNYHGSGTLCLGTDLVRFQPGSAVLVKPGTFHYYFDVPKDGFSWLFFTCEIDAEYLQDLPTAPVQLQADDLRQVKQAATSYLQPGSERNVFETGLTMGRVIQHMPDRALSTVDPEVEEKTRFFCDILRSITEYVDEQMNCALRIHDLAEKVGLSESHLRKLFRENSGIGLGEYLRRSRLSRGVGLIHRSDLSISEIAKESGFESIHAFSQSFRRAMGMPPTAYRKYLEDGHPPIRIPVDPHPSRETNL
jgi:AraC family transcriptional regulator of arabinose operon